LFLDSCFFLAFLLIFIHSIKEGMIRYLQHTEINKEKWDACINGSTLPLVYALSWYLDKVCPGWEALVEDDYHAVFPLTRNRKFGISYLYQPYFTQQLGLFSRKQLSLNQLNRFVEAVPGKFRYVDISLNESNYFEQGEKAFRKRQTFHLDLRPGYEQLCSNYSENHRRNLSRSEKTGVRLEPEGKIQDLIKLFRVNRGQTLGKLNSRHFNMLESLLRESLNREQGRIISAFTETGHYCAGVFFLKSFKRNIFLFSATNPVSRSNGAMFAIINQFIRENAGKEEILDFEGSDLENLARFYRGFGSRSIPYTRFCMNRLFFPARWFKYCSDLMV